MLVYLFHFIILRFRFQVAEHDTVHYELTVVGRIAEVTAISQVAFAVGGIVVKRLVHPVPDGATTEEVGRLHCIPVINQVTAGIPHRMGIF